MSAIEVIQAARLLLEATEKAAAVGVDLLALRELSDRARRENRRITDAELAQLASNARDALTELDGAIAARRSEA